MHIATCFDSKESSSGYTNNHNIDISSDGSHFGIPKCLHGKIAGKIVIKILLNICLNRLTVKKLKYN
jgi:hypothetical protein